MEPRLLLLHISSHSLTTATVSSWVHLILLSNLSRKIKTLLQDSFFWHPTTTTQHLKTKRSTPLLEKLHWLPISERIKYKVTCMCFNAINGSGPAYLSDLLPSASYTMLFWHLHAEYPTIQTQDLGLWTFSYLEFTPTTLSSFKAK